MSTRAYLLVLISFFALGALTFLNMFTVPFYLDDYDSIINNLILSKYSLNEVFWAYPFRQISYVIFAFIQQQFSGEIFYFHLVSFVVHLSNALLLMYLVTTILKVRANQLASHQRLAAAILAGFLFFVLPLNSQAVVYIVQLPTLFSCFFYLAAIALYINARLSIQLKARLIFITLFILIVFAGTMSKQNFFTLPLALLITEWLIVRKTSKQKLQLLLSVAVGALMLAQVIDFATQSGLFERLDSFTTEAADMSRWQYLSHQFSVLMLYLYKFFIPYPLLLEYSSTANDWQDAITWIGFVFLLLLLVVTLKIRHKWPVISALFLLYFCAHLIESSLIPITDLAFEHRAYLPNAFLCGIVAYILFLLFKNVRITCVVGGLLVLTSAAITHQRIVLWNDVEKFYRQNLVHVGDNSRAYAAIALQLAARKEYSAADHWYTMAIQVGDDTQRLSSATVISYMEMLQANGETGKARVLGAQLLKRIDKPKVQSMIYATMAIPHVNNNRCFMANGLINRALATYRQNKRALELKEICERLGAEEPLQEH